MIKSNPKKWLLLFSLIYISAIAFKSFDNEDFVAKSFEVAAPLYSNLLKKTEGNSKNYPHSLLSDGSIKYYDIDEWTGGFWPGSLWYMYAYTKDPKWKDAATKWTNSLENNQYNTKHHDIGFMMYCSYGNALKFDNNLVRVESYQ